MLLLFCIKFGFFLIYSCLLSMIIASPNKFKKELSPLEEFFDEKKIEEFFTNTNNELEERESNNIFADNIWQINIAFSDKFVEQSDILPTNGILKMPNRAISSEQKTKTAEENFSKSGETSAEKKRKIELKIGEKIGHKNEKLNSENLKQKAKIAENPTINNYLPINLIYKMLDNFKICHENRWKIIRQFLLDIKTENFGKTMPMEEQQQQQQYGSADISANLGNHAKNVSPNLENNSKTKQKMPETEIYTEFEQFVEQKQQIDAYKAQIVSAWQLIDTAILCVEIALLPISQNDDDILYRHMFELVDMDKALCALISSDRIIYNLKEYIIWTQRELLQDKMFDDETSSGLMRSMRNVISRSFISSQKQWYENENKILLNLHVYYRLFGAIERQISSPKIEDTVEEIGNTMVEIKWTILRSFVHDFFEKMKEFVKIAAEVGLEQAKQRQCKNL